MANRAHLKRQFLNKKCVAYLDCIMIRHSLYVGIWDLAYLHVGSRLQPITITNYDYPMSGMSPPYFCACPHHISVHVPTIFLCMSPPYLCACPHHISVHVPTIFLCIMQQQKLIYLLLLGSKYLYMYIHIYK